MSSSASSAWKSWYAARRSSASSSRIRSIRSGCAADPCLKGWATTSLRDPTFRAQAAARIDWSTRFDGAVEARCAGSPGHDANVAASGRVLRGMPGLRVGAVFWNPPTLDLRTVVNHEGRNAATRYFDSHLLSKTAELMGFGWSRRATGLARP